MADAWPLTWGIPPSVDVSIDREWGDWNPPKDLRTVHGTVPPALPEVVAQPLPPFSRVREALVRMKGNKPGGEIVGVQAMNLVDLFGHKKPGRLVASQQGWKVEQGAR